jgi:peptide chain release factor 2
MHEYRQKLETIKNEVDHAVKNVNLPAMLGKIKILTEASQKPDFWQHQEEAQRVTKDLNDLQKEVNSWEKMRENCNELLGLFPSVQPEDDPAGAAEFKKMVDDLEAQWHKLEIKTFLNGKYDGCNVILSIHAGTGGKDAQDWAEMLLRMYVRWAERQGFEVQMYEKSMGEEVGLKSATVFINGHLAYGYLKRERGVHRLVRQSPFNAKHSRETSFAFVDVLPEIPEEQVQEIRKEDLRIDTYRSGGAGGQNVNKTSSAVRITHLPTGIVVTCQDERSQLQNKERAMKILQAKLVDMMEKQQVQELNELKGERVEIAWGNQIRSYVLHPYTMVKDHRNNHEEHNVSAILDGEIDGFIEAELKGGTGN